MSEVPLIIEQAPTEETPEPDFMTLASILGYKEDEHGMMLRQLCIETEFRDEVHYGEGILGYIRHCEQALWSHDVQASSNRLEVRQGIWLSLASLHYETGHYSSSMRMLWDIHDDILHSNDMSHLGEISWLLHHVGAREMGRRATIRHMNATQQEHTPDYTVALTP